MDTFLTFAVRQGGITHDSLKEISIIFVKDGSIDDAFVAYVGKDKYGDFLEVWKEAKLWFEKADTVYSFTSLVHKSNLKKTLESFGLELPKKNWQCAGQLVKNKIGNLSFEETCTELGIDSGGYTNDKAVAVAKIVLHIHQNMSENDVIIDDDVVDFRNKKVVITGVFEFISRESLRDFVESNGGKIQTAINSKTEIVLLGMDAGKTKLAMIDELIANGSKINIINSHKLNKILS